MNKIRLYSSDCDGLILKSSKKSKGEKLPI